MSHSHTNISSPVLQHWTEGGTAITNFDPSTQERFYRTAIRVHGDPTLVICDQPYGASIPTDKSLHRLVPRGEWKRSDLSDFWRVFEIVRKALTDEDVSK